MTNYILILGIMDTLNEWNEKLNAFTSGHMDNVFVGTVIFGVLLFVAIAGINVLTKK